MSNYIDDWIIIRKNSTSTGYNLVLSSDTFLDDLMNNQYHEEIIQVINDSQDDFQIILDNVDLDNYYVIEYPVETNYDIDTVKDNIKQVLDTAYNYNYDLMNVIIEPLGYKRG